MQPQNRELPAPLHPQQPPSRQRAPARQGSSFGVFRLVDGYPSSEHGSCAAPSVRAAEERTRQLEAENCATRQAELKHEASLLREYEKRIGGQGSQATFRLDAVARAQQEADERIRAGEQRREAEMEQVRSVERIFEQQQQQRRQQQQQRQQAHRQLQPPQQQQQQQQPTLPKGGAASNVGSSYDQYRESIASSWSRWWGSVTGS